ncbi:hypothetical protein Y032_0021g337 [Ancylostoma ceylanicum]|nr:hypothetical protein Y032_0021g337 [Ancylostoma ceylanicum]
MPETALGSSGPRPPLSPSTMDPIKGVEVNFVPVEKQPVNYGNLPPNLSRLFEQREKSWVKSQLDPCQENVNHFRIIRDRIEKHKKNMLFMYAIQWYYEYIGKNI